MILILILSFSLALQVSPTRHKMNRIAVVTGANKGIGFHIPLQLASCGQFTTVLIGCRNNSRGQKAVEEINQAMQEMKNISAHCDVKYLPLTIGDTESHISFCDAVKEQYEKVDMFIFYLTGSNVSLVINKQ